MSNGTMTLLSVVFRLPTAVHCFYFYNDVIVICDTFLFNPGATTTVIVLSVIVHSIFLCFFPICDFIFIF
ncbi:hypothetical protein QTP88_019091 [Uroleucon formosanum]